MVKTGIACNIAMIRISLLAWDYILVFQLESFIQGFNSSYFWWTISFAATDVFELKNKEDWSFTIWPKALS